jgi:hypothetical protein
MERQFRFGSFVREVGLHEDRISYNDVVAASVTDAGAATTERVQLRGVDVARLVAPYVRVRLAEQLRAVIPLALYLVAFQLLILQQPVDGVLSITGGLVAVIFGLMLFMEGLAVGLMPFGETIGSILPSRRPLPVVLLIAFLLGIGVTFAEPAIGALQAAGSLVDVNEAPYLYALLTTWSFPLVLLVGFGVGLAAVLGTLRFIHGWSLKPMIYAALAPTLGLTIVFALQGDLKQVLGLAWDCGAVTTGPVTVPLVLSLGIGIANSAGKGGGTLSGFGIVTLASLFPILAVLCLSAFVYTTVTPEEIIAAAQASAAAATTEPAWHQQTPWNEIVLGVRAIVPLVLFLLVVLLVVLREKVREPVNIAYGIALCVIGMSVFNVGLTYGLAALGGQAGSLVPSAFVALPGLPDSPLFNMALGLAVAIGFAFVLGFGATLAEPALNALGQTVENLTNGAFRKSMLMYAVSTGVACGIGLGVAKIIFGIPLEYLLIPGYSAAVVLTAASDESFVNIAWDSAGVTTGPVTVPLVLAMGLGLGGAVGAPEGFGILSMASIGPIVAVLTTGLWVRWQTGRRHARQDAEIEGAQEASA